MDAKSYLITLPERLVRSVLGLGAGLAREAGEVVLPDRVRRTKLYHTLVDATLRVLIEQVGGVDGVYPADEALPGDVMVRRTAGNAIEALGIVAFHTSPVWVLAALADMCGAGRQLIPEIAIALKERKLLDPNTEFTTVDQLLDGLEKTSGQLASTINTPPLDVPALRREWEAIRTAARGLQPNRLPSREMLASLWGQLREESVRDERSVFETSSMLAMSALRSVPDAARWMSSTARVGAMKTGQVIAGGLLDHYQATLREIREVGYGTFAKRQLAPYVRAALGQFSPQRSTLTERLLARRRRV
jgi:hypothetical protein